MRLGVLENRVQRRIIEVKGCEMRGDGKILIMRIFVACAGHVA
jgi:hypothetical protein